MTTVVQVATGQWKLTNPNGGYLGITFLNHDAANQVAAIINEQIGISNIVWAE